MHAHSGKHTLHLPEASSFMSSLVAKCFSDVVFRRLGHSNREMFWEVGVSRVYKLLYDMGVSKALEGVFGLSSLFNWLVLGSVLDLYWDLYLTCTGVCT